MNASRRASAAAMRSSTTRARRPPRRARGEDAHRDGRARVPEADAPAAVRCASSAGTTAPSRSRGAPASASRYTQGCPPRIARSRRLRSATRGQPSPFTSAGGRAEGRSCVGDWTRQRRRALGAGEHARAAPEHDLDLARARRARHDADAERRMRRRARRRRSCRAPRTRAAASRDRTPARRRRGRAPCASPRRTEGGPRGRDDASPPLRARRRSRRGSGGARRSACTPPWRSCRPSSPSRRATPGRNARTWLRCPVLLLASAYVRASSWLLRHLGGVPIFAEDVAEDPTDFTQSCVPARRLEHGVHDVGVAGARPPHLVQPLARARRRRGRRAAPGRARPASRSGRHVDFQCRDRRRFVADVAVDADDRRARRCRSAAACGRPTPRSRAAASPARPRARCRPCRRSPGSAARPRPACDRSAIPGSSCRRTDRRRPAGPTRRR